MTATTSHPPDTSHVSHLECSATGECYENDRLHGLSRAGAPLLVRYDLSAVAAAVTKAELAARAPDMWRYREFLPLPHDRARVSLGEPMTPLIRLTGLEAELGAPQVYVKDEGRLPTGSFKARGLALAVSLAKHHGRTRLAVPTAGNAGAAAAAYGARAGMEVFVFTPADTPEVTVREIAFHGARVFLVNGLVNACAKIVRDGSGRMGWHDLSTLEEPYRIEGKKTMGLELAEQLGWSLPDVIYYPTGGGTGFIGMWKAFDELQAIGWIDFHRPRMVAVQATGCHPIVRAAEAGLDHVPEPWAPVESQVHGIRVPKPLGDRLILAVIKASGGFGSIASDAAAEAARREVVEREGLHLAPEGALCYAAYRADLVAGRVSPGDHVVLFNTATGLKSPMPEAAAATLDASAPIDYGALS
jgi:threonine synthase